MDRQEEENMKKKQEIQKLQEDNTKMLVNKNPNAKAQYLEKQRRDL
jgi:hypothetical protein